jgi:hypothetical protein
MFRKISFTCRSSSHFIWCIFIWTRYCDWLQAGGLVFDSRLSSPAGSKTAVGLIRSPVKRVLHRFVTRIGVEHVLSVHIHPVLRPKMQSYTSTAIPVCLDGVVLISTEKLFVEN